MPKVLSWEEKQKRWTEAAERNAERKANSPKRKDPAKHRQQINAWQKENTKVVQLRLTKSSGLIEIIEQAASDHGVPIATYIRQALMERLKNDGYLNKISPEEE